MYICTGYLLAAVLDAGTIELKKKLFAVEKLPVINMVRSAGGGSLSRML